MEEKANNLWYEDFNFCGCGMPDETRDWLADVLRTIDDRPGREAIQEVIMSNPDALKHLVLYFLDAVELTEHGTSVSGCWLTNKGKEALATFKAVHGQDIA